MSDTLNMADKLRVYAKMASGEQQARLLMKPDKAKDLADILDGAIDVARDADKVLADARQIQREAKRDRIVAIIFCGIALLAIGLS